MVPAHRLPAQPLKRLVVVDVLGGVGHALPVHALHGTRVVAVDELADPDFEELHDALHSVEALAVLLLGRVQEDLAAAGLGGVAVAAPPVDAVAGRALLVALGSGVVIGEIHQLLEEVRLHGRQVLGPRRLALLD